jgi:hypothetical protein
MLRFPAETGTQFQSIRGDETLSTNRSGRISARSLSQHVSGVINPRESEMHLVYFGPLLQALRLSLSRVARGGRL